MLSLFSWPKMLGTCALLAFTSGAVIQEMSPRSDLYQSTDENAVQNLVEHRADLALITLDLSKDEADRQQRNSHQSIWPAPDSTVIALDAYVPMSSDSIQARPAKKIQHVFRLLLRDLTYVRQLLQSSVQRRLMHQRLQHPKAEPASQTKHH